MMCGLDYMDDHSKSYRPVIVAAMNWDFGKQITFDQIRSFTFQIIRLE